MALETHHAGFWNSTLGSQQKSNEEMIGDLQRFYQNVVSDAVVCVNEVKLVAGFVCTCGVEPIEIE